ncbi:MAG: hypothetical protein R3218_00695 [Christiangramia sp.]|nr:hypothetical protein [Christiangramia sp.]
MNKNYPLILIAILFCACQSEETLDDPFYDDVFNAKPDFVEYFRAEVNGENFEILNGDYIKGTIYTIDDAGNINLDFLGEISKQGLDEDFYEAFNFKITLFDGPGTYYTGTTENLSFALYWYDFDFWENHYALGTEPGVVTITRAGDRVIEGSFSFEGYNNQLENKILAEGEFGIILEPKEIYHRY